MKRKTSAAVILIASIVLHFFGTSNSQAQYYGQPGWGSGGGNFYGGVSYGGYYGAGYYGGGQCGPWGNGSGAKLNGVASIISAIAPIAISAQQNRQQRIILPPPVYETVLPRSSTPPVVVIEGVPYYIICGHAYKVKQ